MNELRLNIGCGDHPATGWINIDLHDNGPAADVQASILNLPYPDHTASRVYCGHILEHLTPNQERPAALAELHRILHPDGQLMIVGPDMDRAAKDWPDMIPAIHGGAGRWPGDQHQWDATEARTLKALHDAGFNATPLPIATVPDDWPVVSHVGWQFAIHCTTSRP